MATCTVKNIPDELYARLKKAASLCHRSLNSEIIVRLESTLQTRKVSVEETLDKARALRSYTAARRITNKELSCAKSAGRR